MRQRFLKRPRANACGRLRAPAQNARIVARRVEAHRKELHGGFRTRPNESFMDAREAGTKGQVEGEAARVDDPPTAGRKKKGFPGVAAQARGWHCE